MRKTFLALLLVTALSGCSLAWLWHSEEDYQSALTYTTPAQTSFIVPAGYSTRAIASKLESEKIIPTGWAFEWYVSRNDLSGQLQAGTYTLPAGSSISTIAHRLLTAPRDQITITIPEGYRLTQIDQTFAESGLTQPGDLLALKDYAPNLKILTSRPAGVDLEGYLYPDTYFFETDTTTPTQILDRLLTTLDQRFTVEMYTDAATLDLTPHQILTIASLIERESFSEDERPIIAGIIYARLEQGIPLGIDATVQYAVSDGWPSSLTSADLATDSPYNTRKNAGLPPGPICSPSLSSILAALHPTATDYLYYLHDSSGQVHFARTLEEHNTNKNLYLR